MMTEPPIMTVLCNVNILCLLSVPIPRTLSLITTAGDFLKGDSFNQKMGLEVFLPEIGPLYIDICMIF